MTEIILTADKSLMNNFHLKGNIALPFYGSGEMFPKWLFNLLVGKPNHRFGITKYAPYPLRKIEAVLLNKGFDVLTICPDFLQEYIKDAKILGIHTVDPLAFASQPFFYEATKGYNQYASVFFKKLLEKPCIKKAKKNGLKIVVGGEGAWQLKKQPDSYITKWVDYVIIGEGELITPILFKKLLEGKSNPKFINKDMNFSPSINEIPSIHNASNFGCIEIGRGCNRNCKFCEITKSNLRWYPFEKIEEELKINNQNGLKKGLIHAEDVLLFGQNSFIPNDKKLIKLFNLVYKYYNKFIITHFSLAAVHANRNLFEKLMEISLSHQNFMTGEAGIETASIRLMKETMSGKVLPFKPEDWHNIIIDSLSLMHDSNFIPYCSLIIGLPGENDDDIIQTLDLIDELKSLRMILLPSAFTPLGRYVDFDSNKPSVSSLDSLNKELVVKCENHNSGWIKSIGKTILNKELSSRLLSQIWFTQTFIKRKIYRYNKQF
jgi:radical SAM superfamily enzyme YgiQ (UPF0313 family)